MIRFPDQHFTAACLCNSTAANPGQLTRKVAEIYLAKEMKPAETRTGNKREGGAAYAGATTAAKPVLL